MEAGVSDLLLPDGLGPDNVAVMVDDVQRGEAGVPTVPSGSASSIFNWTEKVLVRNSAIYPPVSRANKKPPTHPYGQRKAAVWSFLVQPDYSVVEEYYSILRGRQNPVQFDTEVDVKNAYDDHWRIAVIDTVPDATQLVLGENPFNNPPKEGFRFYIVTIRVQYLGPDSTSFGGSYRLKALGIGGVVYTTFADSCWVIPDDLPDPELFTNGTVEGNVCWEVADDDVDSLQMFLDSGLFLDTPRTWFALQDKTLN